MKIRFVLIAISLACSFAFTKTASCDEITFDVDFSVSDPIVGTFIGVTADETVSIQTDNRRVGADSAAFSILILQYFGGRKEKR